MIFHEVEVTTVISTIESAHARMYIMFYSTMTAIPDSAIGLHRQLHELQLPVQNDHMRGA